MPFSALEHDALVEIFNHGVGQAAHALSEIAGDEVTLTAPNLSFMRRGQLERGLDAPPMAGLCGVRQQFQGAVNTQAILMFPVEQSLELVRMMVGGDVPLDQLGAMEGEALAEIGNIILNSVVASLADLLRLEFEGSLPVVVAAGVPLLQMLDGTDPEQLVMLLHIDFMLESRAIRGYLAFLLDMDSTDTLRRGVSSFIGEASR